MLNIEFEHYSNPLSTGTYNQSYLVGSSAATCLPVPGPQLVTFNPLNSASAEAFSTTTWKWSVYLKKTITPNVAITIQCARDHSRPNYSDGYPGFYEMLIFPNDWMWTAKISANL